MNVEEERKKSVLDAFYALLGPVRAVAGCLGSCLCESVGPSGRICFSTQWDSRCALEEYIRSDAYRKVLHVLDLAAEAPEIRFETVSDTRGMEYVAAVRSAAGGKGKNG
jgi:quinol monooxygenase YgiN